MENCKHEINNIVYDFDGINNYTCNLCEMICQFSKLYRRYNNFCNHDPKEMETYKNNEYFCLKCGIKL